MFSGQLCERILHRATNWYLPAIDAKSDLFTLLLWERGYPEKLEINERTVYVGVVQDGTKG